MNRIIHFQHWLYVTAPLSILLNFTAFGRTTDGFPSLMPNSTMATMHPVLGPCDTDRIAPVFANVPASATVNCPENAPSVVNPTVTDNCTAQPSLSMRTVSSAGRITRIWTATDNAGNTATTQQTIVISDNVPPTVLHCTPNMTVNATDNNCILFAIPSPEVGDNCSTVPTGVATTLRGSQLVNTPNPATRSQLFVGAWRNTAGFKKDLDAAGNVIRTTTLQPSEAASVRYQNGTQILTYGPNVTYRGTWELHPDGDKFIFDKGTSEERYFISLLVTATEARGIGPYRLNGALYYPNTLYEYHDVRLRPTQWVSVCPSNPIDTVVFKYTDGGGNMASCSTVVRVIPSCTGERTPPVFSNVPASVTVTCPENVPPVVNPTITDNCTTQPLLSLNTMTTSERITRTWTATDNAGNTATTQQIITISDKTPPNLSFCSPNITVNSDGKTCVLIGMPMPLVTDNCNPPFAASITTRRGSAVVNAPSQPTLSQLFIGAWQNTEGYRKDLDAAGNVIQTTTLPPSQSSSIHYANGTSVLYVGANAPSNGTWELHPDGTKFIIDKGTANERYFNILTLNATEARSSGPYRLNGTRFYPNTLYEYRDVRTRPTQWVSVCPAAPQDTVVFRYTDVSGNAASCSVVVKVNTVTRVSDKLAMDVRIFPNPNTEGVFSIENLPAEKADLQLTNIMGQVVWRQTTAATTGRFDVKAPLSKGVYLLTVKVNSQLSSYKVVFE
jgi:hypothetical protein